MSVFNNRTLLPISPSKPDKLLAKITNVTCNEPLNSITPDWEITGAQTLNLRAERLGKGPGRVYTITVECKDMSGNVSIGSIDVTVPHN